MTQNETKVLRYRINRRKGRFVLKPKTSALSGFCFALLLASLALNYALYTGRLIPLHEVQIASDRQSDNDMITALLQELN